MSVTLRPYQQAGVDEIRAAYRAGVRAPLYVLPTGGGKSIVLSYIGKNAAERGNRVTITASVVTRDYAFRRPAHPRARPPTGWSITAAAAFTLYLAALVAAAYIEANL